MADDNMIQLDRQLIVADRENPNARLRGPGDDEEKAAELDAKDAEYARKQTYSGFVLLWVAFQSTGVIYGDIGTSPLYVFSSTFSSQPSWDDLTGALSIIIWSLTLIVSIKYCVIVLFADDDGQGGTFALYSLLARYTHIVTRDPAMAKGTELSLERYLTGDLKAGGKSLRNFLEKSNTAKFALKILGVVGVSLVMADGVLTPAQSVLGAIQGIEVVNPDLGTPAIVGISCAILVFLFLLQPFGTAKLGTTFAPIVCIWLLSNLAFGIYNLVQYDSTVLKAFSPYFAFSYLVRNGFDGWKSLGGLLLAFTGVEALFADLGAFSASAIRLSWLFLAYPCLILAYTGQAAYISADATETAFSNPFFNTVPPGTFYYSMVIAVLAAIVASQAMITSTFQLLVQVCCPNPGDASDFWKRYGGTDSDYKVMRLSYFPHIKVVHTSKQFHEQVYMPMANWLLMIGTVIVTAVYNNTTALGNAYGVCVIMVTFITTCMVSMVAILVWRIPAYVVVPIFLIFAALDGAFLSSVLIKVPDGAWFTLVLAVILSSIFILWRFGKEAQWSAEAVDQLKPSALLADLKNENKHVKGQLVLDCSFGGMPVTVVPGTGVFFDKIGDPHQLPASFAHFLSKFAARTEVLIFFHMRPLSLPHIDEEDRFSIRRVAGIPSCYSVTLRHGYADDFINPGLAHSLLAIIQAHVLRMSDPSSSELTTLRAAKDKQTVYVLGKETMKIRAPVGKFNVRANLRRVFLEMFLWIRENSRAKMADLNIEGSQLIEVGFLTEI